MIAITRNSFANTGFKIFFTTGPIFIDTALNQIKPVGKIDKKSENIQLIHAAIF